MKIDPSAPITPARLRRTEKRRKAGGGDFSEHLSSGAGESSGAGPAGPVASVASLLALQEVPDAATGRSKGLMRAEELLDKLEDIQHGILAGRIPVDELRSLALTVRRKRARVDDAKLAAVLHEIELRAEVELAKLGR